MNSRLVLNGQLVAEHDARISPRGDGFMYGHGLFETMKVVGGRVAFFTEHVARLQRSAAQLELGPISSAADLLRHCRTCLDANGIVDGALKLVVYRDTDGPGELVLPRRSSYPPERYTRGFRLRTMPDGGRDVALSAHKTLNYLKNIRARRAAEAAGCDEALLLGGDATVLEGAITNIFVVQGGVVHTPALDVGILPGIARAAVLCAREPGGVRETRLSLEDVLSADEVFVTNSLLGVMPVAAIDDRAFDLSRTPVTTALRERFRTLEAESLRP